VNLMIDYTPAIYTADLSMIPEKLAFGALALIVAMVVTLLLTPLVMRWAIAAKAMVAPGGRHVHETATPRWGGIAMYVGFLTAVLVSAVFVRQQLGENLLHRQVIGILFGGGLITALGAYDDKYDMKASYKLLGQILIAAILVFPPFELRMAVAFNTDIFPQSSGMLGLILSSVLTIIWIVVVTNVINLIDGLDGLAAGVSGISALTFVVIAMVQGPTSNPIMAAAVVGACIGFLRYNFSPASIFMGDAGSHFLGYTIGALSLLYNYKVATGLAFAIPLLILAVPIFDTVFAIVRRMFHGKPIFKADKGHLHHRLLNMGLTQPQAVLTIYVITTIGCLVAIWLAMIR